MRVAAELVRPSDPAAGNGAVRPGPVKVVHALAQSYLFPLVPVLSRACPCVTLLASKYFLHAYLGSRPKSNCCDQIRILSEDTSHHHRKQREVHKVK